jgi:hypothetical protein
MAGATVPPKVAFPLLHDVVYLLTCQCLGQYLQISWRGKGARRKSTGRGAPLCGRRGLGSLRSANHRQCGCKQGYPAAMLNKRRGFQTGISPEREWGMLALAELDHIIQRWLNPALRPHDKSFILFRLHLGMPLLVSSLR